MNKDFSDVQFAKAPPSIVTTVFGITTLLIEEQSLKALYLIISVPIGIAI